MTWYVDDETATSKSVADVEHLRVPPTLSFSARAGLTKRVFRRVFLFWFCDFLNLERSFAISLVEGRGDKKEQLPTVILSSSSDRQVFIPASMDFTTEFSNSGSNSVAADDSDLFPASAFQIAKQAQLKNWTDEMHRSYLNSLEASFAKELHNSLQLRAWKVGNKCKVLRDGCWQKTEFKMSDCLMDSTADSPFFSRDMQSSLNHSLLRSCCENRQPKNSITSFSFPENFKGLIEYDFNCRDSVLSTGAQKFLIKTSWMMSRQELLSIQLCLNDENYLKLIFWGQRKLEVSRDKFINYFNCVYQKANPNVEDSCNLAVQSEVQSQARA